MRSIPVASWPARLADPATPLTVDPVFLGWQRRADRWEVSGYSDHWHRLWLIESGVVVGRCAGREFRLGPGSGAWLPSWSTFECAWPADLVLREVLFDAGPARAAAALRAEAAWELGPIIDQIAAEHAGAPQPFAAARVRHLLALALIALMRRHAAPRPGGLDEAVRDRVVRWARDHLRDRPEPADLARVADLSSDWFARAFRVSFGRSPRRWLAEERIRAAARTLREGGGTVAAVAAAHGFADVAQFARRFRAVMGMPPGRWR